ncbi:MAG TPA: hypothetical protein VHE37_13210 [Nevskiaceae bacterium]|nr:hypothetical protein [Nevskiaceae bacterium]
MINWTRRALYGLALAYAGHAAASEPGTRATRPVPAPSMVNPLAAQWLAAGYPVTLTAQPDPLDPRAHRSGSDLALHPVAIGQDAPLLTATLVDELAQMKDGVGLDLKVPDVTNLYLNLYTRSNPRSRGKRVQLAPDDSDDGSAEPLWSVGGAVNVVRELDGGRRLEVAPQLTVNLGRAVGAPGRLQALLQRARWNNNDPFNGGTESVVQLSFRWRF